MTRDLWDFLCFMEVKLSLIVPMRDGPGHGQAAIGKLPRCHEVRSSCCPMPAGSCQPCLHSASERAAARQAAQRVQLWPGWWHFYHAAVSHPPFCLFFGRAMLWI